MTQDRAVRVPRPSPLVMTRRDRTPGGEASRAFIVGVAGLGLLLLFVCVHISQGAASIGYGTVIESVVQPNDSLEHAIVRHARLPRTVVGLLCGAALAMAGVLLQAVTRNPLSSPQTLAVNSGAYMAVVAASIFAPVVMGFSPVGVAFAGAAIATTATYLVAGGAWASPLRLVMAGAAVSLSLAAITATLQILFENETQALFFWGGGSIIQDDWSDARYALPRIGIAAFVALLLSRQLDVLALGDDLAKGLGQRTQLVRFSAVGVGVLLAATVVSIAGPIGFIGLVVPHVVRLLGIRRHFYLLAVSAIGGANLLIVADIAARWATSGVGETPAGVVTAIVGTPAFIWLARHAVRPGSGRQEAPGGFMLGRSLTLPLAVLLPALAVVLAASFATGLVLGDVQLAPQEVLAALAGNAHGLNERVVLDLRMPRLVVAALAGACLAASGVLLQAVVRNPLAAPEIVGVAPGATVAAVAAIVVFPALPVSMMPVVAFGGGLSAFAIIYAFSWRGGMVPARFVLVGIAVSAFCAGLTSLLVVKAELRAAEALVWLSGTTYARGWDDAARLAPWLVILLPLAWFASRSLDTLHLGEDISRSLGLAIEKTRLAALGLAVALAAAAVATVGALGFVGLIAPHAGRSMAGPNHRALLPVAILLGAILVVLADTIGRTVLAPREIPSGLVTAVVGTPYFVLLLWKARGTRSGA